MASPVLASMESQWPPAVNSPMPTTQVQFQTNPKTYNNWCFFWVGEPLNSSSPPKPSQTNFSHHKFSQVNTKVIPSGGPKSCCEVTCPNDEKKSHARIEKKHPARHQVSFSNMFCTNIFSWFLGESKKREDVNSCFNYLYLFLSKDLWR